MLALTRLSPAKITFRFLHEKPPVAAALPVFVCVFVLKLILLTVEEEA